MRHYLEDRLDRFQCRYRRPMVWYESVSGEGLEPLVLQLSGWLKLESRASMGAVLDAVRERVRWLERHSARDMCSALDWMGVPLEGTVLVSDGEGAVPELTKMLLRDAASYWEVLEPVSFMSFLVDEEARWIVASHHDGMVGVVRPGDSARARSLRF